MKKFLKVIGGIILSLIIVIIVAMVVISNVIDPNRFKPLIETQTLKATGKTLLIEGDLKWSFFPSLGIETGVIKLQNTTGFSSEELVKISKARISIQIIPLLVGTIELGDIALQGLDVHLIKNQAGAVNWALPETDKKLLAGPVEVPVNDKKSSSFSFNLTGIPNVDIADMQVSYNDEKTGESYALENLTLTLKKPVAGNTLPVKMAFDVSSKTPAIEGHVAFTSSVMLNINDGFYQLNNLDLSATMTGDLFAKKKITLTTQGNLAVDLKNQYYTLKDFTLALNDLHAAGSLSIDEINHKYSGVFNLKTFNFRQFIADLGQSLPPMQNNNSLQKVGGSFNIDATGNSANLNELHITLDSSQLNGTMAISDIKKMAGNFEININHINIDDYIPTSKPSSDTHKPAAAQQPAAPIQKPQFKADMQGTLNIGEFQAFRLQMRDVHIVMVAKDNSIDINPIDATLYKGTLHGAVNYNANPALPLYSAALSIDKIILNAMGASLATLSPEYSQLKNISGTASFSTLVTTQGLESLTLKKNLNGNLKVDVKDGKLKGVDLAYYWHMAQDFLNGSTSALSQKGPNETEFGNITATATIQNGTVRNNDLLMQSPVLSVTGSGKADLVTDSVNYRLMVTLQRSHLDAKTGERVFSGTGDDALPLIVNGKLSDPNISIDKKELLNIIANHAKDKLLAPGKKTLKDIINSINF